jgi:hypothetical protein
MSLLARGIGRSPLSDNALEQKSYPTDAQAVKTVLARTPATQLLTLNSQDRLQYNVSFNNPLAPLSDPRVNRQAWNKFRLQRPQPLMGAFATRIGVTEVRFPFYVPNVNETNNDIWLGLADEEGGLSIYQLTVTPRFFTGGDLAEALNSIITGSLEFGFYTVVAGAVSVINPLFYPVFTFNANTGQFTLTPSAVTGAFLYGYNPATTVFSPINYYNSASLALLMGFDVVQVSGQIDSTVPIISNPTSMCYTQYIDIVSDKLNQYASSRDGSSDNNFNRSLLCRLYVAQESSIEQLTNVPACSAPFTLYRQFKTPKMIEWNKEASIDWVDIAVYDQFGNLLPLPTITFPGGLPAQVGVYPDFQITLLATQE